MWVKIRGNYSLELSLIKKTTTQGLFRVKLILTITFDPCFSIGPHNRLWCHKSQFHLCSSNFILHQYREKNLCQFLEQIWKQRNGIKLALRKAIIHLHKEEKNNKNIQPAGECHMNRAAKTMLSLLQVLGSTCKHPHKQHECLPSNIIKCAVKWFRLIGRDGTSLPSYCSKL